MNFFSQKIKILRFLILLIELLLLAISCRLAVAIERALLHNKSWDVFSIESFNPATFPILIIVWLFFLHQHMMLNKTI